MLGSGFVMASRDDLVDWVYDAVKRSGGTASVVQVAKQLWTSHEDELRRSSDLFYTWQYEMRWAAQKLRDSGRLTYAKRGTKNVWIISARTAQV
jgi:hypothetical protein